MLLQPYPTSVPVASGGYAGFSVNPNTSKGSSVGNNPSNTTWSSTNAGTTYTPTYLAPKVQVQSQPTPQPGPAPSQGVWDDNLINSNQNNANAQIESDYNNAMSMLSGAESSLQGQAASASGQIDTGAAAAKNEITNNQTVAEQGANASLSTAEKQGTTAMQQARDIFRQTQQQNNAQLSALGISSSSVAEALAERLGVDVAKRIAGVTGSLQEVRQNTVNELGRIKTYYQGKITDLTNQVNDQKATIQNSLIQGLNQINSARSQAASDKSAARANLLSQVQTQLGNLAAQQQQFEQSLQQWAQQKSAALTPIVQDPNYLNNLISTSNNLNQQFSSTGLNFTPQVNVNAQGTMTGQISGQKPQINPVTGQPYTTADQPTGQIQSMQIGQPDYNRYPNNGYTN